MKSKKSKLDDQEAEEVITTTFKNLCLGIILEYLRQTIPGPDLPDCEGLETQLATSL